MPGVQCHPVSRLSCHNGTGPVLTVAPVMCILARTNADDIQPLIQMCCWLAGMSIVNVYTTNYPEPSDPMGCCNNAEIRSNGMLQPLNSYALPPGGLRQDHHEDQPAAAGPTQGGK